MLFVRCALKRLLLINVIHSIIIPETWCASSPIQSTLMFLAHTLRESRPAIGYQAKPQIKTFEGIPKEELEKKDNNNWMTFQRLIGEKALTDGIMHATSDYEAYLGQSHCTLSQEERGKPYHAIIKKHLYDLQKLAYLGRALSPYVFTIKRKFLNNSNVCPLCKKDNFAEECEYLSWIEAPSISAAADSFTTYRTQRVTCNICGQKSHMWYTSTIEVFPQLLVVLTNPSKYFFTQKTKLLLQGATYKLMSTLGTNDTHSFVELYKENIRYCQGKESQLGPLITQKADDCHERYEDHLWAALYKYQSPDELIQRDADACCTIS